MKKYLLLTSLLGFIFSCEKKEVKNDKELKYNKIINKTFNSKPFTQEMFKNLTETEWVLKMKQVHLYSPNGKIHEVSYNNENIGKLIFFDKEDLKIKDASKKIIGSFNKLNMQFEINDIDTLSNYYGTYKLNDNKDLIIYSNVRYINNQKVIKSFRIRLLFQNNNLH